MSVVESWGVDDVERMLASLDLGHLAPTFKANGVSGRDLLTFGNSEYLEDLGCTKIQMHKIRRALIANGASIKVDDNETAAPSIPPRPATASQPAYDPSSAAPPAYQAPPPPVASYAPSPTAYPPPPQVDSNPFPAYPAAPYGYPGSAAPVNPVPVVAAAAVVHAAAQGHHARYGQARQLLHAAHGELQQAEGLLRTANATATMGVIGDLRGPGLRGPRFGMRGAVHERREEVGNFMEHREMERADRHVKQAAAHIVDAKRLCPDIPDIDMAVVEHLRPGIVFTGGAMMEMARKHKIAETLRNVEIMSGQVQRAMHWCGARAV